MRSFVSSCKNSIIEVRQNIRSWMLDNFGGVLLFSIAMLYVIAFGLVGFSAYCETQMTQSPIPAPLSLPKSGGSFLSIQEPAQAATASTIAK